MHGVIFHEYKNRSIARPAALKEQPESKTKRGLLWLWLA
jgi:hypothetical protein